MFSRIYRAAGIALALGLAAAVANAAPTVGPNGHYYDVIVDNNISWIDANSAAAGSSHLGVPGHLATITSQAENDFVDGIRQSALGDQEFSPGSYNSAAKAEAWLGGSQPSGTDWVWVTGESPNPIPASGTSAYPSYANWHGGEPNNSGGEDQITLGRYLDGSWNDSNVAHGNIGGYVIEYDTVAPVANDDPVNPANSGETIHIDVLLNDDDMGQVITAIEITTPSTKGGTAVVVACELPAVSAFCVNYTSGSTFGGDDEFKYTIFSGDLASLEATVSIQVDGSVSVTLPGPNIPIFGGTSSGVSLLATGDLAQNSGESSVACGCTVRDSRVYAKTRNGQTTFKHRYRLFDIGDAMTDPSLASPGCAELASPGRNKLFVPIHVSVHTDPTIADQDLTLDDFRFGLCLVETGVQWSGPVHLDVDASDSVGYDVDCKIPTGGVANQPLTMGLTTFPEEFTAPFMRPVTVECDPRGVAKWSTWYFIPNATHLPYIWPSKLYVHTMFFVLRGMIYVMDQQDAVEDNLLNDIKSEVEYAQQLIAGWNITTQDATNSMVALDNAAKLLLPPNADPGAGFYPGSGAFPNPKGELASHVMALRYAVCSELANVNDLAECALDPIVEGMLPPLP